MHIGYQSFKNSTRFHTKESTRFIQILHAWKYLKDYGYFQT